jgi:hypothetical protein
MRHPVSKDLFAYWNELRGARAAPERGDIDPAAIRHVLADSFILETDSAGVFPIRLCGTRINALRQSEQKGKSFLELWRLEDRLNVAATIFTVIDGVAPVVAGVRVLKPQASPALHHRDMNFELLLLPLRHFGKTHSRVLGALSSRDPCNWPAGQAAPPLNFISMRVIRTEEAQQVTTTRPGASRVALAGARTPPKFIVYQGGKSGIESNIF